MNQSEEPIDSKGLFQTAQTAYKNGQLAQAIENYEALLEKFPGSEEAKHAQEFLQVIRRRRTELSDVDALLIGLFGIGFWGLVGLGIASIWFTYPKELLASKWFWIAVVGVIAAGLAIKKVEARLSKISMAARRAAIAFATIPFIVLILSTVVFLTVEYQAFVLELVLVVVACIIPAAAYYLFLATRRPSILNEFLVSLSRLGLLLEAENESAEERRARLDSYFQRFEATYGLLRFDIGQDREVSRSFFVDALINAIDPGNKEIDSQEDMLMPQASVRFTDIFRANLVIPLGLVTILTAMGWILVMQPEWVPIGSNSTEGTDLRGIQLTPNWTPLNFAFLGAYFFGIQMLFRRFVRRDLGPNAFIAFANRIIMSVIAVWVTMVCYVVLSRGTGSNGTATVDLLTLPMDTSNQWPAVLLVIAFVVGVFPRMLWQFIATLFAKIMFAKLVIPSIESKQPLSELDGLTVWHESRLEEEDVENIPNMATVDLVDIMLHTQIPAGRLITWVDQSILYSALGPEGAGKTDSSPRRKLRSLGLRSATQVVAAFDKGQEDESALKSALDVENGLSSVSTFVGALRGEENFNLVSAWKREGADCSRIGQS